MPKFWFVPVILAGFVLAGAAPAAAQDCSRETAAPLARQLDPFVQADPLVQALCGPFTGEGSFAMAITTLAPTCFPIQHWGVFAFENGVWRRKFERADYVIGDIVAVGADLRVTTAVNRDPTGPRCVFEGGSQATTWHWNGSTFVATGPPVQVTPPEPRKHAFFNAPARLGVQCGMSDQPGTNGVGITCQSVRTRPKLYLQMARMTGSGRVSICRDRGLRNRCNLGNSGEDPVPTYKYGTTVDVGRFRCRVLRSGVRCVLTKTGKGFAISRNRAARV